MSTEEQYEEGGWGWVVLASTFTSECITYGNVKALGVLLEPIVRDFDIDIWLAGWVVSMSLALQYLTAPVILFFVRKFECRPIFILAGVMATTSYLLAAVSRHFVAWSVLVAIFAGVSSGCFRFAQFQLLSTYFKNRYQLALGIACLGMPIGPMLYAPVTQVLVDTYGWRGAMLILGALTFHLVPCAAVCTPSAKWKKMITYQEIPTETCAEEHVRDQHGCEISDGIGRERNLWKRILEIFDFAVFYNVQFVLVTLSNSLVYFCYVGWAVYVVPHGIVQGLGNMQSSFLPTAYGLGRSFGISATFLQLESKLYFGSNRFAMILATLMSIPLFIVDPFLTSFAALLMVTVGMGLANGIYTVAKYIIYRKIGSGGHLLGVFCWHAFFMGFSMIFSGFFSGWLYEVTGSFKATFIMFGVLHLLACLPLLADIALVSSSNGE